MTYDEVVELCKEKCRYGDLWRRFTFEELLSYSAIKAKRALILFQTEQKDYGVDDAMDSINIMVMALQKYYDTER